MPIKSSFLAECCESPSFGMVCNAVFLQPRKGAWGSPATLPHYSVCVTAGLCPWWQQGTGLCVSSSPASSHSICSSHQPGHNFACHIYKNCIYRLLSIAAPSEGAAGASHPWREMLQEISFCKVSFAEQPKRRQSPGSQAGQTYRVCWMFLLLKELLGIFA